MRGLGPESGEFASGSLYIFQNYFSQCACNFFLSVVLIFAFIMFPYILINCPMIAIFV